MPLELDAIRVKRPPPEYRSVSLNPNDLSGHQGLIVLAKRFSIIRSIFLSLVGQSRYLHLNARF